MIRITRAIEPDAWPLPPFAAAPVGRCQARLIADVMRRKATSSALITLPEYRRAFQIMHGILLSEDSAPERACLFFAVAGAKILARHYKMDAKPLAGCAFYRVDNASASVLAFAELQGDAICSTPSTFHAWVQCGDWVIDFMAPLFSQAATSAGMQASFPQNMFQKPLAKMAGSHQDLIVAGDFYLYPNPELTLDLLQALAEKPAYADLENIAAEWFRKPPKKIRQSIPISDSKGKVKPVNLSNISVVGAW